MALSRTEIQQKSDSKRGVKTFAYKLPQETGDAIARLAEERGMTRAAVIAEAIALLMVQE